MNYLKFDISKTNYIALPGLLPGVVMYNRATNADNIIKCVSDYLDVTATEMKSKRRHRFIVEARMIAIYLIKKHTNLPLGRIASMFGGRDHTTAIHSINTVKSLIYSNDKFKQQVLSIENNISV